MRLLAGDNCAKWILRIAKAANRDLTINLRHLMDFGDEPFEFKLMNSGAIIHNTQEYVSSAGLYL